MLDPTASRPHVRRAWMLDVLDRRAEAVAARLDGWRAVGDLEGAARIQREYDTLGYDGVLGSELDRRLDIDDWVNVAHVLVVRGETSAAIDALERAYDARDSWMPFLRVDPRFIRLHDDPRFIDLLNRIGLL